MLHPAEPESRRPLYERPPEPKPAPEVKTPEPSRPPAAIERAPESAADLHAGRSKKVAGLALAGVGVASLAVGIAFGVLAQNVSTDVTNASKSGQPWNPSKDSEGKTDQILEGVFVGIGAVAAVTGVVVAALGFREAKVVRAAASLTPVVSPTSAGASLRLSF
jgi:hypothetical protein